MIERKYPHILECIEKHRSVLVFGPRGTGKTYFLTRVIAKYPHNRIINLLDKAVYLNYLKNPSILYKELKAVLSNSSNNFFVLI